ncbi:MAG: hypothetical protein V1720_01230 [bacterium]
MNKIVFNFGLLVFFISIILFSQKDLIWTDILLRAFVVFVVVTLMLSLLAITFVKAINKASLTRDTNIKNNLIGNQNHE